MSKTKIPAVGQRICWRLPEECDADDNKRFVKTQSDGFPGKLRIAALVEIPGSPGKNHYHVTHKGKVIESLGKPVVISSYWFHLCDD